MLTRKISCVLLLVAFVSIVSAQDFTMKFVFTDALGNRDSVVTGAADDATGEYNPNYDAPNLAGVPRNDTFDVRLSNGNPSIFYPEDGLYTSKQKIIPYEAYIAIEVKAIHWPIEVSWTTSGMFDGPRVDNSVFTEHIPGLGGEGNSTGLGHTSLNLGEDKPGSGEAGFTQTSENIIDVNGDTIFWYWIGFVKEIDVSTANQEASSGELNIFPNPTTTETINLTGSLLPKLKSAALYNAQGQEVRRFATVPNRLRIGALPPGFYVFRFQDTEGRLWTKRFLRGSKSV